MAEKLRSLKSHNDSARRRWKKEQASQTGFVTGLACPKCGAELTDFEPLTVMGKPPKVAVVCQCGYEGWRAA